MVKQNKYDDPKFFAEYEKMPRSAKGLEGAGEWHVFKALLPDLRNKSVLDLGCGFGWHCRYAREQKASKVVGVDISEMMLQRAREMTNDPYISYIRMPIEDINFSKEQFDVVISSLALHYVESFEAVCQKVFTCLKTGGAFVFWWNIRSSLVARNRIGIMTTTGIVCTGQLTTTIQKECERLLFLKLKT